jgi:hypothetical protein
MRWRKSSSVSHSSLYRTVLRLLKSVATEQSAHPCIARVSPAIA